MAGRGNISKPRTPPANLGASLTTALLGYVLLNLVAGKLGNIEAVPKQETHISAIIAAMNAYKTEFEEYPMGSNSSLMKALRGENAKRLVLIEVNRSDLNNDGEFVDPWGTPYQIAALRTFG